MKIAIDKIVIDESIYPRNGVSALNLTRLKHALESGVRFPPITIEAKTNRLVDGRHRYELYKLCGLKTIEATEKVYKNEADLFADAVRLNISHGIPLDHYTIRNAILRLETYGYSKQAISEIVRLPAPQIEKIERGFANDESGKPLALKGGLSHLHGQTLDQQQQELNRRYSGTRATRAVQQLIGLLANDMYPPTPMFATEMDELCQLWRNIKTKSSAA
jgi:ParB-like chromosome segregation protein Spo0J